MNEWDGRILSELYGLQRGLHAVGAYHSHSHCSLYFPWLTLIPLIRHLMLTSRDLSSSNFKVLWVIKWSQVANPPTRSESGVTFEYFDKGFARKRKTIVKKEIKLHPSDADKISDSLVEHFDEFHLSTSETSSRHGSESSRSRRGSGGSFSSSRGSLRF